MRTSNKLGPHLFLLGQRIRKQYDKWPGWDNHWLPWPGSCNFCITMWHKIFCGLMVFCVFWKLIFAIRTDWFFLLGINFCNQYPALIIFLFLLSTCKKAVNPLSLRILRNCRWRHNAQPRCRFSKNAQKRCCWNCNIWPDWFTCHQSHYCLYFNGIPEELGKVQC